MKINLFFWGIILLASCNSKKSSLPEIKFQKDTFSFGEIKRGDSVTANYFFSNAGETDLIIEKIGPSCGCTDAFSGKDTLKPKEESFIQATYHSGKDSGKVLKTIIVESNCSPVLHVLYLSGQVKK